MSQISSLKILNQITYTDEKNDDDNRIHNYLSKIRNDIHNNLSEIQNIIFQLKSSFKSNKVNVNENSGSVNSFNHNAFLISGNIKLKSKKKCFRIVRSPLAVSNFLISSIIEKEKNFSQERGRRSIRGKYNMYTAELKNEIIEQIKKEGKNVNSVAQKYGVPVKSVKRWLHFGPVRQKGGGRKPKDPLMEIELMKWIDEKIALKEEIKPSKIQQKARTMSKFPEFKASKGWLEKFKKKHNIRIEKF